MEPGPLVQAKTPIIREMSPANADFGKSTGPRIYPELLSQESALGEYVRVLVSASGRFWPASSQFFPWLRSPASR